MRYYSLNDFYRKKFGHKVYKLALSAGGTCPNRDGSKGVGGCAFCAEQGSGESATAWVDIDAAIDKLADKACGYYVAYLQSYTNTYCEIDKLRSIADRLLLRQDIVGIAIATRPDCIDDEMLEYLRLLSTRTFLTIEMGLQTVNDDIADMHNRQYKTSEFFDMVDKLKKYGIRSVAHIINGMRGETKADMLLTVKRLSKSRLTV